jgi:cytochrome c oxidase subunit 1
MLMLWQVAAERAFGAPPLGQALYRLTMASLVVFVLPAPAFYFMFDLMGIAHRNAFTDLLWYGLTLPPMVLTLGLLPQLWRHRRALPWRDPAFLGMVLSLLMFNVGGVFGFFLGVSDTRTPAHYHAVIGGVNLALMFAFAGIFLPLLSRPFGPGRATRAQFWLYGLGQLFWSLGMFIAGASGVPRKTAGAEQQLDAIGTLGMGISGSAHLVAIAGGIMFVWMALSRLLRKEARHG